ncbi:IDEAL domain-containing protein [Paenibacillus sp. N4]|uniref:IDEAL domain-containing protein n=1 Tax=Paenibacillus vietnamensis TaxID=2590547 RepID=UPI001CD0DA50|nr:IDEAL domain-containing protein [Paenibacillus vietnamensis]MCA0754876.1 IDEAL domain-containing protein [Paenibacillus vietnamensis]
MINHNQVMAQMFSEPAIEIAAAQRKQRELLEAIDATLDAGDREQFYTLSAELKELNERSSLYAVI